MKYRNTEINIWRNEDLKNLIERYTKIQKKGSTDRNKETQKHRNKTIMKNITKLKFKNNELIV